MASGEIEAQLREALREEWELNHYEHCKGEWPHAGRCAYPLHPLLGDGWTLGDLRFDGDKGVALSRTQAVIKIFRIRPGADVIQVAIDALGPGGGVVQLPPGTYVIKGLRVPDNVRVEGIE